MRLDVNRLRDMVAENPGIRTVQLSDRLDCDFDVLEEVLATEVRCKRLICWQVMGPNNRKANAYRLAGTPEPQQQAPVAATPAPAKPAGGDQSTVPANKGAPRPTSPMPSIQPSELAREPHASVPAKSKGYIMPTKTYTPRAGSKTALAVAALLDGPMNCQELGKAIDADPANVHALLGTARTYKLVGLAKDGTGLAHFYLVGMPLDDRFTIIEPRADNGALQASVVPAKTTEPVAAPPQQQTGAINVPRFKSIKAAATQKESAILPAPADDDFLAGLLSNGKLLISDGITSLTLSAAHTNKLFSYLDKARANHE